MGRDDDNKGQEGEDAVMLGLRGQSGLIARLERVVGRWFGLDQG